MLSSYDNGLLDVRHLTWLNPVVATPAGFEPAACRLEGGCSIQLSYGAIGPRQWVH